MPGDQRRRLIASARLLESDQAGDRQAAIEAVRRLLPANITIADLLDRAIQPPSPSWLPAGILPVAALRDWQRKSRAVAISSLALDPHERAFVKDMAGQTIQPTARQMAWLNSLASRAGMGGGA